MSDAISRHVLCRVQRSARPAELRVSLCEYKGRSFVELSVWFNSGIRGMVLDPEPNKRFEVRPGELRQAAAALLEAADLIQVPR